jgi:hypothetical protein
MVLITGGANLMIWTHLHQLLTRFATEEDWNAAIVEAARKEAAARANRRRVVPTPITCQLCGLTGQLLRQHG